MGADTGFSKSLVELEGKRIDSEKPTFDFARADVRSDCYRRLVCKSNAWMVLFSHLIA